MADAKISHVVWTDIKQAVLNNSLVDAVRWWFSKRKIRKYTSLLDPAITRRSFFSTPLLLLAPNPGRLPPSIPEIQRQIVSEYLKTKTGRMKLAAAMVQPLRRGMGYASISRKVFQLQQLPAGAVPFYDGDLGVAEHLKESFAVNGD